MMKQWNYVGKGDEKSTCLQLEDVQRAPDLQVSQVMTEENEPKKENKKSKMVGWPPEDGRERSKSLEIRKRLSCVEEAVKENWGRSAGEV